MLSRRFRYVVVLLVILAMAAPAYASVAPTTNDAQLAQSDSAQVVVPAGESIKLGLATDLSNLIPDPGQDIANGGILAVEQRNEAGGVAGFTVELDVQDDRCVGEDATTVANQFASDPQTVAVVGHVCSGASIAASGIYQDARIPMVSPSSTAVAFTANGYDIVNRVAFTDGAQGTVDARYLYEELDVEFLAIIHDNSDYGLGLANVVQEEFERIGGEIASFDAIDVDEQDYRPVLTVLAGDPPDAIFFGGYQGQAALLVNQMLEVGLEDTLFFSDDGVFTEQYLDNAGDASEGSYASFVVEAANEEGNAAFDEAYEARFGVAPDDLGPFHAHTYDAANILMNAIEAVAVVDDSGNLVIDREALIVAVRETTDYEGLTGTLSCDGIDGQGECGAGEIGVNIVEDGEWTGVDVPAELQFGQPFMDDMMDDMDDMEDEDMDDMDDEDMEDMEATEEPSE